MNFFRRLVGNSCWCWIVVVKLALGMPVAAIAAEASPAALAKVGALELRDQFDAPQRLVFPTTNVTVLTVADKKGSEQMDGWINAVKARFAGRVEIRGLADVRGVPKLFQGRLRAKFQETRKYPVMMDWSGETCNRLGCVTGSANILVLGSDGTILHRFAGPAVEPVLGQAVAAVEAAIAARAGPQAGTMR